MASPTDSRLALTTAWKKDTVYKPVAISFKIYRILVDTRRQGFLSVFTPVVAREIVG